MADSANRDEDRRESFSIDTHTLNPNAARLAENEGAFLGSIHDDDDHLKQDELAAWIGGILGEDLRPDTLFDDLANGVRLLHLAKSIHLIKSAHLKDSEYRETVKNLHPDEFSATDHRPPQRASLLAKQRSNIAKFLEWCRHINVPLITIFETADLTQRKNLRQVTTCLFYVSRIAARFGIEPPSSVKEAMKAEEAKLLDKKIGDGWTSTHKVSTSDTNRLISNKPPIYEHEDEDGELSTTPEKKLQNLLLSLNSEKRERTSTPSSVSSGNQGENLEENFKPISPVELKFEDEYNDAVVVETLGRSERKLFDFESPPFKDNVQISETQDMVIVDQMQFRPVDNPVLHEITNFNDGSAVRVIPAMPDENENTRRTASNSYDTSSSSDENEYHTAQDTKNHYTAGLTYHTAFVDHDSDDEEPENSPELVYPGLQESMDDQESTTSSDDIPDLSDMRRPSPNGLYLVATDVVVQRHEESDQSSEESTTDVESYVSNDVEREVIFTTDTGVGTDGAVLTPADFIPKRAGEIMINFPPYFEIAKKEDFKRIPPQEYIVAPVRNEPIYTVPKKTSTSQRESHTNPAYDTESDSQSRPSRDYARFEPRQGSRQRRESPSPAAIVPTPYTGNVFDNTETEKGTQTHVSLTQDIVRIINEMDEIPRIRTTSSTASSGNATPGYSGGATVVIRTQYQRTLPTSDRDVTITQVSELQNAPTSTRPPRWGSVNSSTRHRSRDPEAASGTKEVRRSIMRRASSLISEQFEKAAVIAKKYQKQIAIVSVLLILTAGALAAMLAVFPLT